MTTGKDYLGLKNAYLRFLGKGLSSGIGASILEGIVSLFVEIALHIFPYLASIILYVNNEHHSCILVFERHQQNCIFHVNSLPLSVQPPMY